METNYSLYLTIRKAGKTIPYPAEEREDSFNHGFVDLKSEVNSVDQIPEVRNCSWLQVALQRINASETAFYTAGCDYSLNQEEDGTSWAKGYIDFVFLDSSLARDSDAHFHLFQAFDAYLRDQGFEEPIDFHWELEQTEFLEAGFQGWTICLWLTTDFHADPEICQTVWGRASDTFCSFIEQYHQSRT